MVMVVRGKAHLFDTKDKWGRVAEKEKRNKRGRVEVTKGVWDVWR